MKNKNFTLFKMQVISPFFIKGEEKKKKSTFGSTLSSNKPGTLRSQPVVDKTKAPNMAGRIIGITLLMSVIAIVPFMLFAMMGSVLADFGQIIVIPAIAMIISSLVTLFTSIFKVNGLLFAFREYDMVMVLPVKTSTIVANRMLMLYGLNMFFCLIIMVPALIVYGLFEPPTFSFMAMYITGILITPLIPVVIASVIGTFIAMAAAKVKRKAGMQIIFTGLIMVVWMFFSFNMDSAAEQLALHGQQIIDSISSIYIPGGWFIGALQTNSILDFALFVGISILAFLIFAGIVGKNYRKINSIITTVQTKSNYKLNTIKSRGAKTALFHKEWKRFSSSAPYVLNSGMSVVFLTIISVVIAIFGQETALSLVGIDLSNLPAPVLFVIPFGISLFVAITCTTCASISLEGKNLWILKSCPINTKDILLSKVKLNIVIILIAIIINSTLLNIAFAPSLDVVLMMYITPLMYGIFTSLFGLKLNLALPKFEWGSEVQVIKQSAPGLIAVLVGMAIVIVPAIIMLTLLNSVVIYATTAALAVISALLYKNIVTKGVQKFESF